MSNPKRPTTSNQPAPYSDPARVALDAAAAAPPADSGPYTAIEIAAPTEAEVWMRAAAALASVMTMQPVDEAAAMAGRFADAVVLEFNRRYGADE